MKWISFCPLDFMSTKTKWKNPFSFTLYKLCHASCVDVSREQSRLFNCKFLKTKATLLIWRIRLSMIMIKVETNSSITATSKRNFRANWRAIKAMNKKESWIIDKKYFNCESMTLRGRQISESWYATRKTKELHLGKIKRPISVWLFYGWPSLPLLA